MIEPLDDERYEEVKQLLREVALDAQEVLDSIDDGELMQTYVRAHQE